MNARNCDEGINVVNRMERPEDTKCDAGVKELKKGIIELLLDVQYFDLDPEIHGTTAHE
jgi:hypothetical protein